MKPEIGYAIVVEGEETLCFTSEWTKMSIWQIYKTRADADEFAATDFGDATYKVVPVEIRPVPHRLDS